VNTYLIGSLILAGDDGDDNVTIPSVGQTYTDSVTVRAVQTALQSKGFSPGSIDGKYGPKTAAAIKKMQSAAGIPQTGVIDYGVLMALGVSIPAPYIPSASSSSSSSPSYTPSSGGYASVVPTPSAPGATLSKSNPVNPAASDSIPGWKIGVIAGAGALLIGGITVLAVRR
jgi:peptidoglycan hydrolase-like protein with peptidoglycan-binding domain